MKFFGVVVGILGTATGAWAGDGVLTPKRAVTACLNPGANISVMYRGQAIAGQILKNAGIRLDWSHDERTCAERKGILFAVSLETSPEQHAGALAYALPFDGTRVVLFYDRVLNTASTAAAPWLLGHVLAHEIVHILQGVDTHSPSGVMKARWEKRDLDDMRGAYLSFTPEDLILIDHGMDRRGVRGHSAE